MELLSPIKEIPSWFQLATAQGVRIASDERLDDELQRTAQLVGRNNVSYEHVWKAVRDADGHWLPVRCQTLRRAILLASSALQHRTQAHEVMRRGRVVCIRLMPKTDQLIVA